jgi:uncharacterized protein (DUF2164 family)
MEIMNKIASVELTNFRNIKHMVFDLKNNPTVIKGNNNLGKSNILSALMWFFTNTLLTDKWGTGENDIDSIVPVNQAKGEHVSVKVTFETGVEFTKVYKTKYDSKTGKANGHTTDCYINSSLSKNATLWNTELMKEINFKPTLLGFNELRIFTDPLYALQKLEPKELRRLLIALGCEVTNEEVFEALANEYDLSIIKEQESKYRGNFYDMRADYKRKLVADRESLTLIQNQLYGYNDTKEYNSARLEQVEQELKTKRDEYYNIKNSSGTNPLVIEAKNQLSKVQLDKDLFVKQKAHEKSMRLSEIEQQLLVERERIANEKINRNKDLELKKGKLEIELNSQNGIYEAYQTSLNNIARSLEASSTTGKNLVEQQKETMVKLNATKVSTYPDLITCPMCSHQFVADPVALATFEANKQNETVRLSNLLEKLQNQVKEQSAIFKKLKEQREETQKALNVVAEKVNSINEELNHVNSEILANNEISVDLSTITHLEEEKANIYKLRIDTSEFDTKIDELHKQIYDLVNNSSEAVNEKLMDLDNEISTLELEKQEINIEKSKWLTKQDLMRKQEEALEVRNNHEAELEIVNAFIHKQIEMCNQKAYEKTGFKFVMLEENLSNDQVKEVCYLTVDDVPFANVNTSRKLMIGTIFINKIKDILETMGTPRNSLPILCDKMESISDNTFNYYYAQGILDKCQFITTKVTEEKEITIC